MQGTLATGGVLTPLAVRLPHTDLEVAGKTSHGQPQWTLDVYHAQREVPQDSSPTRPPQLTHLLEDV